MKTNILDAFTMQQLRNKENIYDEDKHFAFTMNSYGRNKENIYYELRRQTFSLLLWTVKE